MWFLNYFLPGNFKSPNRLTKILPTASHSSTKWSCLTKGALSLSPIVLEIENSLQNNMHTSQITPTPTPFSKFPFFINYFKMLQFITLGSLKCSMKSVLMHDRWTVRNLSGKSLYEEGHRKSCSTEPWTQLQLSSFVCLGKLDSSTMLLCDPSASLSAPPFESCATRLHVDLISSIVSETGVSGVSAVSVVCGFPLSAILENPYSLFCSYQMHSSPSKYVLLHTEQTVLLPASDATCFTLWKECVLVLWYKIYDIWFLFWKITCWSFSKEKWSTISLVNSWSCTLSMEGLLSVGVLAGYLLVLQVWLSCWDQLSFSDLSSHKHWTT